uniref:Multivesicular body subunit 12A n=1 Tax=Buteo japonicus TaxID=224669 RepID=A0A8C0C3W8_9AVES
RRGEPGSCPVPCRFARASAFEGTPRGRSSLSDRDRGGGWRRPELGPVPRSHPVQAAPWPVVTDLQPRTGISRKKRVYMKLLPLDTAETAVFDLKLSSKSKALPHYMKIGEIGNFAIWCKKGPVLKSKAQPISEGLKQLSLQPPDSDHKCVCTHLFPPRHPKSYLNQFRTGNKSCNSAPGMFLKHLSLLFPAMDGVPFTLHPKFESKLSSGSNAILADLNVKSLADIEKEYNYAFVVERTAAARLPPSVC